MKLRHQCLAHDKVHDKHSVYILCLSSLGLGHTPSQWVNGNGSTHPWTPTYTTSHLQLDGLSCSWLLKHTLCHRRSSTWGNLCQIHQEITRQGRGRGEQQSTSVGHLKMQSCSFSIPSGFHSNSAAINFKRKWVFQLLKRLLSKASNISVHPAIGKYSKS